MIRSLYYHVSRVPYRILAHIGIRVTTLRETPLYPWSSEKRDLFAGLHRRPEQVDSL